MTDKEFYMNELNKFEEKVDSNIKFWENENNIFQKTLELNNKTELRAFILNNKIFYVNEDTVDRYIEKDLEEIRNKVLDNYNNFLKFKLIISEFKKIAKEENLIITKSPHSDSYYACKENEEISWGYKPENSYRISDHWNWDLGQHCPTDTNKDFGVALAKMINGKYTQII